MDDMRPTVTPLAWPAGWPRTSPPARRTAKFARYRSLAEACDGVRDEVRRLGAPRLGPQGLVISTNLDWAVIDGPKSCQGDLIDDPGAAVYWYDTRAKVRRVMACDHWTRVRDNIHAIALSLAALRGLARWGATEIVERAFAGFAALPPSGDDWRSVLGFAHGRRPDLAEVKASYRARARDAHPDRPDGDPHAMIRLNQAMEAAERELS